MANKIKKTNSKSKKETKSKVVVQKTYLQVIEDNEWEGETWNFFVDQSSPEAPILKKMVLSLHDNNEDCGFSLVENVSEADVKVLLRQKSPTAYMNQYNLVKKVNKNPKALEKALMGGVDDVEKVLYKGGCFEV